jgi:hypothetical protein
MLAKRCKNWTTLVSNSRRYERMQVIYGRVVDSINQLHNWLCIYFVLSPRGIFKNMSSISIIEWS